MRSQARASARRTNDNLWIFGSLGATEKKCGRGEKGFLPGVIHKLLTFDLASCGAGAAVVGGGFGAWAVNKKCGRGEKDFPSGIWDSVSTSGEWRERGIGGWNVRAERWR